MIKTPFVPTQVLDLYNNDLGDLTTMGEAELKAKLESRLENFVGQINNDRTREELRNVCENFVRQPQEQYPEYCVQFGFDFETKNNTLFINTYPKNIKTLLIMMGHFEYAMFCPGDVETYECELGKFCVQDGRAMIVPTEEEND